jgi:hypothetical protein
MSVDYSNQDITGLNLSNQNLTGGNFTNTNATNVNFTNAVITNAIFKNTLITGAILTGITFSDLQKGYLLLRAANHTNTAVNNLTALTPEQFRIIQPAISVDTINTIQTITVKIPNTLSNGNFTIVVTPIVNQLVCIFVATNQNIIIALSGGGNVRTIRSNGTVVQDVDNANATLNFLKIGLVPYRVSVGNGDGIIALIPIDLNVYHVSGSGLGDIISLNLGPTGAVGTTGPVGAQGTAGSAGTAGPAGAVGSTGPVGAQGTAGAAGPAGAVGSTGPVGAQGPTGAAGAAGAAGPAGAVGSTGPVGAQGTAGAAGPAGAVGSTGPVGAQGAAGSAGTAGPAGAVGPTGPLGASVIFNGSHTGIGSFAGYTNNQFSFPNLTWDFTNYNYDIEFTLTQNSQSTNHFMWNWDDIDSGRYLQSYYDKSMGTDSTTFVGSQLGPYLFFTQVTADVNCHFKGTLRANRPVVNIPHMMILEGQTTYVRIANSTTSYSVGADSIGYSRTTNTLLFTSISPFPTNPFDGSHNFSLWATISNYTTSNPNMNLRITRIPKIL